MVFDMSDIDKKIAYAIRHTVVLRQPKQTLSTFGTTNIHYYIVTIPTYSEFMNNYEETVVREGRVITEKPQVITPKYLFNLEGFSDYARKYLESMIEQHGPHTPGIFYKYRNEPKDLTIVSSPMESVVNHINNKITEQGDQLSTIIKGVDEMWDVSLMKFIHDITEGSIEQNITELGDKGLFDIDHFGIPRDARNRIEELFSLVAKGKCDPSVLKLELDRWDVFEEYEDRFLNLFRKNT